MSFSTLLKRSAALLLTLLALAFPIAAQEGDPSKVIEDIRVQGSRRIPRETVVARMFTRPGDVYDKAAIERDFASLWNTGYYEDLRFELEEGEKGGYLLVVYVKEKPTIRDIQYKGLGSASQSDVLERFKERKVGLSMESQYDPTKVKKAEVALKELLAERGRQFATIRTEIAPIPPASVGVTFNIKEGPKVKVGKIAFEGNKELSDRKLRSAMKNLKPYGIPKSIFLENLISKTFDASKLQEDAERVRFAYQDEGYFRAIVGDPVTQMRDTRGSIINPFARGPGKRVDITLPIEEGDRFKLRAITFTGGKAITNTRALRSIFPMRDGDIFRRSAVAKGLQNLQKAYGELGYIKFSPVPNTKIDDEAKMIDLEIDLDEGKQYSVRRIEFQGNTTTRDKVIRREILLEEGGVYNSRYWEVSIARLNQLQYFETLKAEQDAEVKTNDQDGTVDLTLKVKEKGKNSIGLTGGVSGLAGSFVGINYETNNFLGLGVTLRVEANVGSRERNLLLGVTQPYLFDRPLQFGFTVYNRRFDFNAARETEIATGQQINLPSTILDQFQNYRQSSTGFSTSLSYPIRRSFKRVGITYSWDTSSVTTFSEASRRLFEQIAFRNVSGPNALQGVVTSRIFPSFTWNTIANPQQPQSGYSLFLGGEIGGLGGNVASLRPVVEWKHFKPIRNFRFVDPGEGRHIFGYRVQASYVTGYRGLVAPPAERFYSGGDNDLRGFDVRTISPYAFFTDLITFPLVNPDDPCVINPQIGCASVPVDPQNPLRGTVGVPIPVSRITIPGGDTNLVSNVEYRIPIVGPVTLAAFADAGLNFITRTSQLRLTNVQLDLLNSTLYGCPDLPRLANNFTCGGGINQTFSAELKPASGTNFVPRMSTGLELQVILPIINAPLRIYYAYNPFILDKTITSPSFITPEMFPNNAAGRFTFERARQNFVPDYRLREPRKTFRFTVATTF